MPNDHKIKKIKDESFKHNTEVQPSRKIQLINTKVQQETPAVMTTMEKYPTTNLKLPAQLNLAQ